MKRTVSAPGRGNGTHAGAGETRRRILAAAGEVFAEHGFQAATVRQITTRAAVNLAAVNYHFRDKAELYAQVLNQAYCARAERLAAAVPAGSPEQRLRQFVGEMLSYLLDPDRPDWHRRLMAREMAEPTAALDRLVEETIRPLRDRYLLPILQELTGGGLSEEGRMLVSCSIMAQCLYYLQCRPVIGRLYPQLRCGPQDVDKLADHVTSFSLAAIRDLARRLRAPAAGAEPTAADRLPSPFAPAPSSP